VSFADKAKSKASVRMSLDGWLDSLPDKEREGAEHMLKTPEAWTLEELVEAFREEGAVYGRDAFSKWRKANNVVRR
jgi:transposase